jgi:hypothetical protein
MVGRGEHGWNLNSFYRQTANITLPAEHDWIPIGRPISDHDFSGSYDGGGFTISGLRIPDVFGMRFNGQGMFGWNTGLVKNIRLIGVDIRVINLELSNVGAVAGVNGGTVQNCYVQGTIIGLSNVGGAVGTNEGIVQRCHVNATVTGRDHVGGVVGRSWASRSQVVLRNSYSTGTVTGEGSVGGVQGVIQSFGGDVVNCYSTATVTGNSGVGGLVGWNDSAVEGVRNNVALNPSVTATNPTHFSGVGRIVSSIWNVTNNHARSDMNTGSSHTPDSDPNGIDGADVTLAATQVQSWWENTVGFSFGNTENAPWQWDATTQRPRLYWE